ncbi:hypothetical protein XENORESO_013265 [Xenotaenia resolanae]|uniref:Uncharacterized protein n=1 Tax=Xenotaenia resolanae TaxID=208358 RepID=A0ABV0VS18_9TELE
MNIFAGMCAKTHDLHCVLGGNLVLLLRTTDRDRSAHKGLPLSHSVFMSMINMAILFSRHLWKTYLPEDHFLNVPTISSGYPVAVLTCSVCVSVRETESSGFQVQFY